MTSIIFTRATNQQFCWLMIVTIAVFLPSATISAFHTTRVASTAKTCSGTARTIAFAMANDDNNSNSSSKNISEAQRLLDKAAQLRAEIATAEGKTLEQVQEEADKARKQQEQREKENRQMREKIKTDRQKQPQSQTILQVPGTFDDMVRQGARAVERAFQDGKTRQIVRFNLVEELEGKATATEENEWPGGTKQMYRESGKPLTNALLREVRAPTKRLDTFPDERRTNPQLKVEDIWDFDGTANHRADAAEGPSADVQAMVFPNTDTKYLDDIDAISQAMGKRLFLLVNPFWRNIDSWGFNILAPGAKKRAQNVIYGGADNDKAAFEVTYALDVFSVRGEKCVAVKAYPYDWELFAFREDDYYPNNEEYVVTIRLGSCKEDPTSQIISKLINERPEFKETKTMRQMKKLGGK